jgi:hypothetical protein
VFQQFFDILSQSLIPLALRRQVGGPLVLVGDFEGVQEEALCLIFGIAHQLISILSVCNTMRREIGETRQENLGSLAGVRF